MVENQEAPHNMKPSQFERRVLVCVTGLSPQVVTETLYALATQAEPWIPTEVHVLTTSEGARRAQLLLLEPDRNEFNKLLADQDLRDVCFGLDHIHVMRDVKNQPLSDIRTQADNMAVADGILRAIAQFAADPDCAIHVSLAGGRKSMGFFAGYALSLCGRVQDRLSHVLVSEGFESHTQFFFPPRKPVVLFQQPGNKPLSTADAVIELADIPFVRLRGNAPAALVEEGNFRKVVEAAQRASGAPSLQIHAREHVIECAGERIMLSTLEFAIYAWHATRQQHEEQPEVVLNQFNAIGSRLRNELHEFGKRLYHNDFSSDAEEWQKYAWTDDSANHAQWLSERRSRII